MAASEDLGVCKVLSISLEDLQCWEIDNFEGVNPQKGTKYIQRATDMNKFFREYDCKE